MRASIELEILLTGSVRCSEFGSDHNQESHSPALRERRMDAGNNITKGRRDSKGDKGHESFKFFRM